jgi:hypothetical protein
MSDEKPSDDPDRLREIAVEALATNRAALRGRKVPIDLEPPTIFRVEGSPTRSVNAPLAEAEAEAETS